jgi:predicted SPOUT superfamily RNA methylase MTH1
MTLKNQTDKELADAGRMLAAELSSIADELARRGFTVELQGYYRDRVDRKVPGTYWEFEVKRVTEEKI